MSIVVSQYSGEDPAEIQMSNVQSIPKAFFTAGTASSFSHVKSSTVRVNGFSYFEWNVFVTVIGWRPMWP